MPIEPQMRNLSPAEKSASACRYALRRISESPEIAYHAGYGTQIYALLTEAHAAEAGITIEKARENYPPAQPRELEEGQLRPCPFCGGHNLEVKDDGYGDHTVRCGDCKFNGPEASEESDAREYWNDRAIQCL